VPPAYPPVRDDVNARDYRSITVPANVVVPVVMDQAISSANAYVGQPFTATVVSDRIGDSEFPSGTKISGVVSEARPRQGDQPGVLDLDFRSALLPDGTKVRLNAELVSLDNKDLTRANGRIVAKSGSSRSTGDHLKVIGIGAGVGFVAGKLLHKNATVTTLLGALGGFLYDRSKDTKASDAVITRNMKLGVLITNTVSYNDRGGYYKYRRQYVPG